MDSEFMKSPEPFLPVELEQIIFEMAFDPDDLESNVNMTLVAKRVRQWIRAMIFRIFNQDLARNFSDTPFPNFSRYPSCRLEEVGVFAKHLFITWVAASDSTAVPLSEDHVLRLLQHCPNVENLACWSYFSSPEKTLGPILEKASRIRRLSLSLPVAYHNILRPNKPSIPQELWSCQAFRGLTHLELTNCPTDWPFEVLDGYAALTHFSVYSPQGVWTVSTINRVLTSSSSLRVFMAIVDISDGAWQDIVKNNGDLRVVLSDADIATYGDWLEGAKGRFDIWSLAEWIVTARKCEDAGSKVTQCWAQCILTVRLTRSVF
ncbi:hypothetical protein BJ165DRAFT_1001117 [Panaeolus papilionaceus]|nr:hypothetical protein BJ165DRAFT_1001117 [Panaeolus papilionaceus]